MKKLFVIILLFTSTLLFSQNSFSVKYSPESFVLFYISKHGGLDYELANSGSVSYDFQGKTSGFGDVKVSYDFKGRPSQIGDISISYNFQGKISNIGQKSISYDYSGRISQIGSASFSYDFEGKLITAGRASISYDFQGRVSNVTGSIGNGLYLKMGW